MKEKYFVYIILCADGRLYTGITNDLERRLKEHRSGRGARFTRSFGVDKLLFSEKHPDRSAAMKREAAIKRWPRERKLALTQTLARRGKKRVSRRRSPPA